VSEAVGRWLETCELFHELADLDAPEQLRRLTPIGETDPELKRAVEALLAGDNLADARLAGLKPGIADVLQRNLRAPYPDPLRVVGRMLSHFRVIEPLAAGGMGVVYRARDTRLGRDVALKLPLPAQHLDPQGRARFLREAHAAGTLDHPNLCSIYEIGESEDGQPFLAMALYPGEPLKARIAREGPLPLHEALAIARQIASGLAFAHAAGVVHRDLKPANIMVLPDGTVKILDFGLAKLLDVSQTSSAAALGTMPYVAPEQILGRPVDERADLWSLGVLLYEMLTGVVPFRGGDIAATAHAILHHDAPRPSATRAELTRSVDDLISALLQKDPTRRYASAQDVAGDLDALQQGRKPAFPRHAPWWRHTRLRSRRAARAVLAVAITMLLAASSRVVPPLLDAKPTRNAEAHQMYLRARQYERTGPLSAADTLYRRALGLDPDFALARARLALVLLWSGPRQEARLEQARQEAMAALRTQPGQPDAHFALGQYWQMRDNHTRALAEFSKARKHLRKSSALHSAIGSSYRALGRWPEAVTAYEEALRLDPTNISDAPALAITYGRLRRYRDSQRTWDRYIARTPDAYGAMLVKGYSVTRSQGIADTLAAALRRIPPDWDVDGMTTWARVLVARMERRPADALAALAASRHTVSEDDLIFRPHALLRGIVYADAGDADRARVHYDSARAMLQDTLATDPNDPRFYIALGMALAGLEEREAAIGAAERAMELAPIGSDMVRATAFMGGAAEILAQVGDNDAALRLLEQLLEMPAGREASVPLLGVDPSFDRLRRDPRFQQLLTRFATT
jgi:serine/threonine protein kinase/tetratricopeptide (TPR) repeat protein